MPEIPLTRTTLILLAMAGSAASLAGAFFFQHVVGILPCHLCILQRYPHGILVALAVLALLIRGPALPWLGALVALGSAGIAVYHSGVERKLWAGPTSCTGGQDLSGLSGTDLLSTDFTVATVMCDEINFSILGLTFANMNVVLSLVLAAVWVAAARAR